MRRAPWRISPVTHWRDGFLRAVEVADRRVYVDAGGACVIALMGCALPTAAGAWSVRACGGQSSRWVSAEPAQMEMEARWGEVGTSWGDALRRGMLAWNDGGAARRMFRWRDRRMDRVVHGNGRNEITVVAPASIDNVWG